MFSVLPPPAELTDAVRNGTPLPAAVDAVGAKLAEAAKPIVEAAQRLGVPVDPSGFMFAWVNGVRVIAEKDGEGKIVGIAFLALGKRWIGDDGGATLLAMESEHPFELMSFVKSIAAAMGATHVYHETRVVEREDGVKEHIVVSHPTG